MVDNAALLWTRRFATQPVIRLEMVASTTENLTVATDPTVDYYTTKASGSNSLLEAVETALETHSSGPSFTLTIGTIAEGERRIQISATSNFRIYWADAATTFDSTILGFDAVDMTTFEGVVTAENMPGQVFRPRRPVSFDSRDRQPVLGGVAQAVSGASRVSNFGRPRKERRITFEKFLAQYALEENAISTEPENTFEEAWQTSLGLGRPFEVTESENDYSVGVEYKIAATGNPLARDGRYPILWNASMRVARTGT